jgi:hypothetical protein
MAATTSISVISPFSHHLYFFIFDNVAGINFWPPKPGFTVMISTYQYHLRKILKHQWGCRVKGNAGLHPAPFIIWIDLCRWLTASAVGNDIAPASAKATVY